MATEWIQSNGGPLLLLPDELRNQWGGTANSDYERACGVYEEIATLPVADGVALVLGDEPHQTCWVDKGDGGLLVRWVYADDEGEVWAAVDGLRDDELKPSSVGEFVVGDSARCVLQDSADPGGDLQSEHLVFDLPTGTYSVETADVAPNDNTRVLVHRLRRQC